MGFQKGAFDVGHGTANQGRGHMNTIQMLWLYRPFSNVERLPMTPFLKNGHPVHLYTYGAVPNLVDNNATYDPICLFERLKRHYFS